MREDEATILDNWFPEESSVRIRRGSASHATGLGSTVESVMTYAGGASEKMFAAADGAVYETTNSGAVGAAEFSSMLNNRWQHDNFGNSAGNFLYIVNGFDAPRYYDGSSWTVPTITGSGLTASNLIYVNAFKRRLFFIEKNTLSFWYFPVETIAGAITRFRLDPLSKLGGYLMAMGNWTVDGGDGIDDYAIFLTSKGEVFIFQGTDPGDANNWAHVGTYRIGAPIGRRCLEKLGSEIIAVTEDGFVPMSQFLPSGRAGGAKALSDRVSGAISDAVRDRRTNFGWQPIVYPAGHMMLFNVPIRESIEAHQYVLNTNTGAWCRFKDWNANCFGIFGDNLYFGGNGTVYKADTGDSDDGADISATVRTSFSYLGNPGRNKTIMLARPLLSTDGNLTTAMGVDVDFASDTPTGTPTFTEAAGENWNEAVWNEAVWGGKPEVKKDWQAVSGYGDAFALRFNTSTQGEVKWSATNWLYEPGALL